MKRFTQFVCLMVAFFLFLAVPAAAVEEIEPRESQYFASFLGYLYLTSSTEFQVWGEVTSMKTMDQLGISSITVQRSSDDTNWTSMATYKKADYSNFIREDTVHHEAYITYTGTSGYYYRALIWFYAKKGTGEAEYSYYTDSRLL